MGCNPKLPKDTRLIVFNPRWCLDEEFADALARQLKRLHASETGSTDWLHFQGHVYPDLDSASRARFMSTNATIARDPHVHMRGRSKEYDEDKIKPTPLIVKMVQILKTADSSSRGDVVMLSGNYKKKDTQWMHDENCHVISFSYRGCCKMLDHFDTELGQALWDIRLQNRSNFGIAFHKYLKSMVDIRTLAVSYCIPSVGHCLEFNDQLILPLDKHFDYTRSECWDCAWVAESDRMLRRETGRMTLYTATAINDYLVKPVDVIIRYPSLPCDRWCSWWPFAHIDGGELFDSNSDKEPTELTFLHGSKMWVNNFPDANHVIAAVLDAPRSSGDEPQSKKHKRAVRTQNLLLSKRIWVENQQEALSFYLMCLLFG